MIQNHRITVELLLLVQEMNQIVHLIHQG